MPLLPESPAFTTACTEGRSPSNFPNLFPSRRAVTPFWYKTFKLFPLCFWETDFLISQRPSGPLGKASDCSVYLSFIPECGVVTTCREIFPFPCNGNNHEHILKALWDPLVKICSQLRARRHKLSSMYPGQPHSKFKYLQDIQNKTNLE